MKWVAAWGGTNGNSPNFCSTNCTSSESFSAAAMLMEPTPLCTMAKARAGVALTPAPPTRALRRMVPPSSWISTSPTTGHAARVTTIGSATIVGCCDDIASTEHTSEAFCWVPGAISGLDSAATTSQLTFIVRLVLLPPGGARALSCHATDTSVGNSPATSTESRSATPSLDVALHCAVGAELNWPVSGGAAPHGQVKRPSEVPPGASSKTLSCSSEAPAVSMNAAATPAGHGRGGEMDADAVLVTGDVGVSDVDGAPVRVLLGEVVRV